LVTRKSPNFQLSTFNFQLRSRVIPIKKKPKPPSFGKLFAFTLLILVQIMPSTALRLCYFLLDQKVTKKSRTASGTFLLFFDDFSESRLILEILNCWLFAVR
jgi:hypothetical protein